MDKIAELARSQTVRRTAVGLYVLALSGVIGAFFIISLFQVENSTYLLGDNTVEKGRPNAVRGVIFDTPTGQFITNANVDLSLYDFAWEGESSTQRIVEQDLDGASLASGRTAPTGHVHLQMKTPDSVEPGDYSLVVHATGPRVSEDYYAGIDVAVEAREPTGTDWPTKTQRLPEKQRPDHEQAATALEGPIAIDLLPRDGEVIRGVESTVYVRTYLRESGEPVSATVRFEKVEGINATKLPERIRTDKMGIARVRWNPGTDQNWEFIVEDADMPDGVDSDPSAKDAEEASEQSSATIRITTVPAQFSLTLNNSVAAPGDEVEGYVKSLNRSGGMMVDLYDGDEWTVAEAFGLQEGSSGLRVKVPSYDDMGKLQRVQLYGGIYGTGNAWDAEYVWLAEGRDEDSRHKALREIIAFHADHTDDPYFDYLNSRDVAAADIQQLDRWTRAYLDGIPVHFDTPPVLINNEKWAKEQLDTWKSDIKSKLMYLVAFGLVVGLMVVLYLVVLGLRSSREHQQMLRDVDTDMAIAGGVSDDDAEVDDARVDDWVAWLQIVIVIATLIFFAAGILLLLSFM